MHGVSVREPRVLIVEDDSDLRRVLSHGLEEEGFDVSTVGRGADALELTGREPTDLLVIDIGLPDSDGRDLCQALRSRGVHAPVLFLTAKESVPDRVSGFRAGGDDYVTKPFAITEVAARLQALLRRASPDQAVRIGDLCLDPAEHAVLVGDARVALTPTEFRLLGALASRPKETVRRRDLVRAAWPDGAIVHDNTLDVYVARLRRKLADLSTTVEIGTVHGVGYRLQ
jgi:two-component system response regulator MprA